MSNTSTNRKANHLLREKSPYLLQHAYNPVEWYPWSEEAFARARAEEKPIFLSIGYATCHWCHVMERESFESEEIANFLRDHFISIKVDREERPDIDAIYMTAVQALSGGGGWPMTVFLTPELKPFFGGTYFPPKPAYGRPSFQQLIEKIAELWQTERAALVESSESLTQAIAGSATTPTEIDRDQLAQTTFEYFARNFDPQYGGFGQAPKFPRPVQFDFLFNYALLKNEPRARDMSLHTLKAISLGGIHDHIGGGFHRYSVDRYWRVSHFEKMLYDQAQLLESYLDAYQLTHDESFASTARDIISYVLRDLGASGGAFYSAEDADSEGEEGTFYVWTKEEITSFLSPQESSLFIEHFGVTEAGNFEHGKNVLHSSSDLEFSAKRLDITLKNAMFVLASAKEKLFQQRVTRERPIRDEKILASWNGLMIAALARASAVLKDRSILHAALNAATFLWNEMVQTDANGRAQLYHRWKDGEAKYHAYLETYAFTVKGLLALYEYSFDRKWLDRALLLQKEQDERLWDSSGGYFTAETAADVIVRTKSDYDGAEPSGNSIAALNLLKLSQLTDDPSYRDRAEELVKFFTTRIGKYPYAMPELMIASMRLEQPRVDIVIAADDEQSYQYLEVIEEYYLPQAVKQRAVAAKEHTFAATLSKEENNVFLCHDLRCEMPAQTSDELRDRLAAVAIHTT